MLLVRSVADSLGPPVMNFLTTLNPLKFYLPAVAGAPWRRS